MNVIQLSRIYFEFPLSASAALNSSDTYKAFDCMQSSKANGHGRCLGQFSWRCIQRIRIRMIMIGWLGEAVWSRRYVLGQKVWFVNEQLRAQPASSTDHVVWSTTKSDKVLGISFILHRLCKCTICNESYNYVWLRACMNMLNSVILRPRVDSLIWLGYTGRSDTIKKKVWIHSVLAFRK